MDKYLFFDLDNTILFDLDDGSYSIKEEDIQAIQKGRQYGINFVAASGRSVASAAYISKLLNINIDMIGINGLELKIGDSYNCKEAISIKEFDKIYKNIYKRFSKQANIFFMNFDGKYVIQDLDKAEPKTLLSKHTIKGDDNPIYNLNIKEFLEITHQKYIPKIQLYIYELENKQKIQRYIETEFQEYTFLQSANPHMLESCFSHIGKEVGIHEYIMKKEINKYQCYCIGDSENDNKMIEMMGKNSFCVKHGSDITKDKAEYIVENISEAIEIIKNL